MSDVPPEDLPSRDHQTPAGVAARSHNHPGGELRVHDNGLATRQVRLRNLQLGLRFLQSGQFNVKIRLTPE